MNDRNSSLERTLMNRTRRSLDEFSKLENLIEERREINRAKAAITWMTNALAKESDEWIEITEREMKDIVGVRQGTVLYYFTLLYLFAFVIPVCNCHYLFLL